MKHEYPHVNSQKMQSIQRGCPLRPKVSRRYCTAVSRSALNRNIQYTFATAKSHTSNAPVYSGEQGTLINMLREDFPGRFGFSVSHTTRKPRPGEEHGTHYFFSEKPEMQAEIDDKKFIEHANVHGNLYGTRCGNRGWSVCQPALLVFRSSSLFSPLLTSPFCIFSRRFFRFDVMQRRRERLFPSFH